MYTDDTSLSFRNDNIPRLNQALKKHLEALDAQPKGNKLFLNVDKAQWMIICTKQKHDALKHQTVKLNLSIHHYPLETV